MGETRPTDSGRIGSETLARARSAGDTKVFKNVSWSRSGWVRGNSQGQQPWGDTNWAKWWWAAPLLFLLFAGLVTVLWGVNHIENTIESRAAGILEDASISSEGLTFDASYRDVEVGGEIPDGTTADEIEEALEADNSTAFNVRNATITATAAAAAVVAETGDIAVTATSDGEAITLNGTVPSEAQRDELVAAAEGTGLEVIDQLTVSGLEPTSADPDTQIGNFSALVGTLAAGSFTAANLAIGVDGPVTGEIVAADEATAASIEGTAGDGVSVSAPATLGSLDVTANYDGDRIVLDGMVLSEEQSAALESAAGNAVGADNVVNNLTISGLDEAVEGADGRVDALAASLGTFGGLVSGDASMNDTDLTVNGVAADEASQTASTDALASGEDAGLRPGGEISLAEAPAVAEQIDLLQAELDSLQDEIRENVVFETNTNELTPTATATLDKVVAAMNRYPLPVVEVGGHTDDRGGDDLNAALSQSRADAVAAYVSQNVDPGRLEAIGFGESQPIADNGTPEGQAQNRRVEFIAKESF